MKSVQLQYKTLGITRKISALLPERWDELTADQLVLISSDYITTVDETEILCGMLGIKKSIAARLDSFQRFCIAMELQFMDNFKPHYSFVIRKLNWLNAPRPRLEGMSFGQFMFVDTYYEVAITSEDPEHLNKFIACLYLPEGKPFNEQLIEDRANYIKLFFKPEEKTAISLNYRLVKEWICERYPLLFRKSSVAELADAKPVAEHSRSQGSNWVKVYESLVGDDIVNQDKYSALPVHTVFRYLTSKLKENGKR
jgi:hypothetical protein